MLWAFWSAPVRRWISTLHLSLEALEAIHIDWKAGVRIPGTNVSAEEAAKMQLQPKQITAFLVGVKSKVATFHLQRSINSYRKEPMLAILPGVALQQLWDMVGIAEKALMLVSAHRGSGGVGRNADRHSYQS